MREDATVLILDDDFDFARTLKAIFEAKGYPVVEAHDGGSALRIVQGEAVAVAVIDFKLGDMPGIEVLRKLKQRSPSTECILLTGFATQELAIEAINLGGFGFLQKPCDLDQLLVMVRRAVEKRDALAALRESERHTRAILHSSLDAVVTIDEMGLVIDWNPQAEATLGWLRREAIGRELFDLVFRDEDEALRRAWGAPAEISLLGRPVEATLRHKNGQEIRVEWVVTMVEMADRRTFTFFIKDVTRRKRLEEEFLSAHRKEAVGLLAGGVLHDFSNVLTAIMGQSALLRQDPQLVPESRQAVQEIFEAAQQASDLSRQLLTYSRQQLRDPRPLDLNDVVVGMSRLLKRIVGEHIDLRKQLAPKLRPTRLDRSELEQLIVNLVVNARDAMPDGGVVRIETSQLEGDRVQLAVRDHGAGMAPTTLIRAFEPFFTTRQVGRGAGLGLSTVKNIAEKAGGEVTLESEPEKGTVCRVTLPVCEPWDESAGDAPTEDELRGNETVLVVEDEEIVRKTLVRVLERFGYRVLVASGGPEGRDLAESEPGDIDLLITDIVMPHLSGTELARLVSRQRPNTRVLYVSGYSDNLTLRPQLDRHARLLAKPFTPDDLLQAVRELLDVAD